MSSLVKRLERLVSVWPVVPERAGRDFGEYLRIKYSERFRTSLTGTHESNAFAEKELSALKFISDNHFKQKYEREPTNFSGKIGTSWGFSQLGTALQEKFSSKTFTGKLRNKK